MSEAGKSDSEKNTLLLSSISIWKERWFLSTNAKDIGTWYLIFALFSGLLGTAFSVLIRMELSGPGVQYIADNQLYNSIITAHAILMIFFMVEIIYIFNFKSQFSCAFSSVKSQSVGKVITGKINNDNNTVLTIGNNNNDNQDNKDPEDYKHKYVKVLVQDPFNNRDIILKITQKPKGVPFILLTLLPQVRIIMVR